MSAFSGKVDISIFSRCHHVISSSRFPVSHWTLLVRELSHESVDLFWSAQSDVIPRFYDPVVGRQNMKKKGTIDKGGSTQILFSKEDLRQNTGVSSPCASEIDPNPILLLRQVHHGLREARSQNLRTFGARTERERGNKGCAVGLLGSENGTGRPTAVHHFSSRQASFHASTAVPPR